MYCLSGFYKMKSSFFPLYVFLFLVGLQPLLAQDCQSIDTFSCFINKIYQPGKIKLELKSSTSIDKIRSVSQPIFADVTGDCSPEVIVFGRDLRILILNPDNGDTLFSIPTLSSYMFGVSRERVYTARIEEDQPPVFFYMTSSNNDNDFMDGRIICVNMDGTTKWISNDKYYDKSRRQDRSMGFADFNQDGIPEIYAGNRIFNARTGAKLADGGDFGIGRDHHVSVSVAAQLDDDPSDLELAAGYTIYKVNITNPDDSVGNSMTAHNILLDGKYRDGLTAIGDINGDGILDVVVHHETPQYESRLYAYTFAGGSPTLLAKAFPPKNTAANFFAISCYNPVNRKISAFRVPSILIIRQEQLLSYQFDGTVNLTNNGQFPLTNITGVTV
jgi:hypothetical protein